MASEIILPKRSEFSKNNNPYIETACAGCGLRQMRRTDAIKTWNGLCRSCASRKRESSTTIKKLRAQIKREYMTNLSPEEKAKYAERARQQILRQGGIPNARPFVGEGKEGRRMAGPNHYAWKGGLPKGSERECYFYKEWRKAIFKRDDYTCQICKIRGGRLEADHIKPWSTHPELRYEVSNGRTLCKPCHQSTETYGGRMFTYQKKLSGIPRM